MQFLNRIYPLFFAIFPLLFYYNTNRFETTISSLFFPLSLCILIYVLIYLLLHFFVKDKQKMRLLLAIFLFYFFSFTHFDKLLSPYIKLPDNSIISENTIIYVIYTIIFLIIGRQFLKIKDKNKASGLLIIIGAYLIMSPLLTIVPWEIGRANQTSDSKDILVDGKKIIPKGNLPDIYYIIPDRYANDTMLSETYDFDNSQFLNFLKDKGFYVARESFTNFPKTHLSLASSLSFEYINYLTKELGENSGDYTPAFRLVQDNKLARILKSMGYYYIYFGDWWEPTRINPYADENINLFNKSDEFLRKFSSTTIINPLFGWYLNKHDFIGFSNDRVRENILYKFEKLKTVAGKKSPKFVFVHMLSPHYPYLLDKNCKPTTDASKPYELEKAKYIKQLQCTNKQLEEIIENILSQSKTPPVIILQSDEGPFKSDEMNRSGEGVDWKDASDQAIQTHMRILNSYYIPRDNGQPIDYESVGFYQGVSPVNSFRLVFNAIFDTDFALLKDKSYIIPHLNFPYKFIDKTELIKFDDN